jgi:endonuclease/exonuclease/phosphatase family metal-dependent hydrolase
MALLSLKNPSMEILICGDFNVDYLSNCTHKQKLSLLLGAYNMIHTVDLNTRFQNGHSSATDNIFVDKFKIQSYKIIPLSNALSDHEAQCIILNKFFPITELKNVKHKNIQS